MKSIFQAVVIALAILALGLLVAPEGGRLNLPEKPTLVFESKQMEYVMWGSGVGGRPIEQFMGLACGIGTMRNGYFFSALHRKDVTDSVLENWNKRTFFNQIESVFEAYGLEKGKSSVEELAQAIQKSKRIEYTDSGETAISITYRCANPLVAEQIAWQHIAEISRLYAEFYIEIGAAHEQRKLQPDSFWPEKILTFEK